MKYSNLIFDLDGTLTNPAQGVLNSLRFALQQMNYPNLPSEVPMAFIGPPLQKSFSEIYKFNKKQTEQAVEFFRAYYGKAGLYENEVYPGIHELLETLHDSGRRLFVATSKLEKYARLILEHFEIDKYFDDLSGADYGGTKTKAELIDRILIDYRLSADDCLMVGDTQFDLIGAQTCEIDSMAVGYGYGTKEFLLSHNPTFYVDTVEELSEFMI